MFLVVNVSHILYMHTPIMSSDTLNSRTFYRSYVYRWTVIRLTGYWHHFWHVRCQLTHYSVVRATILTHQLTQCSGMCSIARIYFFLIVHTCAMFVTDAYVTEHVRTLNVASNLTRQWHIRTLNVACNLTRQWHVRTLNIASNLTRQWHVRTLNVATNLTRQWHVRSLNVASNLTCQWHVRTFNVASSLTRQWHVRTLNVAFNLTRQWHVNTLNVSSNLTHQWHVRTVNVASNLTCQWHVPSQKINTSVDTLSAGIERTYKMQFFICRHFLTVCASLFHLQMS